MNKIIPPKLKQGDEIRFIAPSDSLPVVSEEQQKLALKQISKLGFKASFGKHVSEINYLNTASIESRIEDLHQAFLDDNVKAIIAIDGGFNANQLLRYIDWNVIISHPKVFCGYSDITVLLNAIYAKTGLVTYSGPLFCTLGISSGISYTLDYFRKCVMDSQMYSVSDLPYLMSDNDDRNNNTIPTENDFWTIHQGEASGTILGGNLCTFNLLQGTEYMPQLRKTLLFLEDDYESMAHHFDRDLQSLIHQSSFFGVEGVIIGRFEKKSGINRQVLHEIIESKKELANLPILANVVFGHTNPKITFPIGGEAHLNSRNNIKISIELH